MTDNEIIKALECHLGVNLKNCSGCAYTQYGFNCLERLHTDLLDLINRLQTENERLQTEKDNLIKTFGECQKDVIKEFAERLKAVITINNTNDGYLDYAVDYNCLMEDIDDLEKEMVGENDDSD